MPLTDAQLEYFRAKALDLAAGKSRARILASMVANLTKTTVEEVQKSVDIALIDSGRRDLAGRDW